MKLIRARTRPWRRQELAKALGCTPRTVDKHRARGNLKAEQSPAHPQRVLIDADEARRFAAWLIACASPIADSVRS